MVIHTGVGLSPCKATGFFHHHLKKAAIKLEQTGWANSLQELRGCELQRLQKCVRQQMPLVCEPGWGRGLEQGTFCLWVSVFSSVDTAYNRCSINRFQPSPSGRGQVGPAGQTGVGAHPKWTTQAHCDLTLTSEWVVLGRDTEGEPGGRQWFCIVLSRKQEFTENMLIFPDPPTWQISQAQLRVSRRKHTRPRFSLAHWKTSHCAFTTLYFMVLAKSYHSP